MKAISLTSMGWELALPIFGGVIIGYHLDQLFDTSYTFTLSLLGLGIIIAYFNIYRHIELEMLRKKATPHQTKEDNNNS